MKIKDGRLNEEDMLDETIKGMLEVSKETAQRHVRPTTVLLMRDPLDGKYNGVLFVFNFNPQHFKFEQKALVAVQQGRGGYVVSQNGLGPPRWTIQGNFGWRLRTVPIPPYIAQGVIGKVLGGGNLVHRIPRVNTNINDIQIGIGDGDFQGTFGQLLSGRGGVSFNGKQTLDGQQAWYALRDLITYYFDTNLERVQNGKPPYELVWYDSLHSLKWVVVPSGVPTLERSVSTQGTMPYTLEFIGVYDDARRNGKVWDLLSAADWGNQ